METRHVSRHYARRNCRQSGHYKRRFPKLSAVCDVKSCIVLGGHVDRGPKPDVVEFPDLMRQALSRHRVEMVLKRRLPCLNGACASPIHHTYSHFGALGSSVQ